MRAGAFRARCFQQRGFKSGVRAMRPEKAIRNQSLAEASLSAKFMKIGQIFLGFSCKSPSAFYKSFYRSLRINHRKRDNFDKPRGRKRRHLRATGCTKRKANFSARRVKESKPQIFSEAIARGVGGTHPPVFFQ